LYNPATSDIYVVAPPMAHREAGMDGWGGKGRCKIHCTVPVYEIETIVNDRINNAIEVR
jgi:hypothetical protein